MLSVTAGSVRCVEQIESRGGFSGGEKRSQRAGRGEEKRNRRREGRMGSTVGRRRKEPRAQGGNGEVAGDRHRWDRRERKSISWIIAKAS